MKQWNKIKVFLFSLILLGIGGNVAFSQKKSFSKKEIELHSQSKDCWMVIEGNVYDLTSYISKHPTDPQVLLDLCGKDGTEGWKKKGNMGRPHSKKAELLLKTFLKGSVTEPTPN